MTDKDEEKWWEEYVEVRVNVLLPAKLVGDKWPDGLLVGYKKLIDPDDVPGNFLSAAIKCNLDRMSEIVLDKVQGEVERGTER